MGVVERKKVDMFQESTAEADSFSVTQRFCSATTLLFITLYSRASPCGKNSSRTVTPLHNKLPKLTFK